MDRADEWRVGMVETRAPAYGPDEWIRQHDRVTIRPGDTASAVASSWAIENGRKPSDVRVIVIDR